MRILAIGILASCALAGCNSSRDAPMAFDRVAWSNMPAVSRNVLVQDLVDRNVLAGLTRDEVRAMLGPPSFDSPDYVTYLVDPGRVLDIRFSASEPHVATKVFTRVM